MINKKKYLPSIYSCKVTIVGMGYVGLPLAIEFAKTDFCKKTGNKLNREVFGFDIDTNRINDLTNSYDSNSDLEDEDLVHLKKITFTNDLNDISDSDVFIIAVPTPIDKNKIPNFKPLEIASINVGNCLLNLRADESLNKKIIIFESTVYPGLTEELCIPIIEENSNLKSMEDFSFGYSPERINPGDKDHTLSKVKKITSGSDDESRLWIDHFYASIIEAGTFSVSNIKIAEAAKIIENVQRDLNIALINELSLMFQQMGIDTEEVIEAASTKWNFIKLFPGLVGGHCIGVDPYYLIHKSKQLGYLPEVLLAGRRMNNIMGSRVAKLLMKEMVKRSIIINNSNILILGFSFKENSRDFRNTGIINVYNELQDFSCNVDIYDPLVDPNKVFNIYNLKVLNVIPRKKYDAILIAVGHSCFKDIGLHELKKLIINNGIIFDLKYIYKFDKNILRI